MIEVKIIIAGTAKGNVRISNWPPHGADSRYTVLFNEVNMPTRVLHVEGDFVTRGFWYLVLEALKAALEPKPIEWVWDRKTQTSTAKLVDATLVVKYFAPQTPEAVALGDVDAVGRPRGFWGVRIRLSEGVGVVWEWEWRDPVGYATGETARKAAIAAYARRLEGIRGDYALPPGAVRR